MALQVTVGTGSLIALGLGVGDIALLFSLARRTGSWLTASSGDATLLELLDTDEFSIITRRGLLDCAVFNKRWGRQMSFLLNDRPTTIQGDKAEAALGKLSQFTAIMVSIVATLDAFATSDAVKGIVKELLLKLLNATEYGEDVLIAQCSHRINSWRSSAIVRGLSSEARKTRRDLATDKHAPIMGGLVPKGDIPHIVNFLHWLLAGNANEYFTTSSDVAGIAFCLAHVAGIDWLGVKGLGSRNTSSFRPCQVEYNPKTPTQPPGHVRIFPQDIFSREPCTTINLDAQEESMTAFPVDAHTANRCRSAWLEGRNAALNIYFQSISGIFDLQLKYRSSVVDAGEESARIHRHIRSTVQAIAQRLAFFNEGRVCNALQNVFRLESEEILKWLIDENLERIDDWNPSGQGRPDVENPECTDPAKINAFTVLQAFFMGYYYEVFLKLVDTSFLTVPTVEGAWAFRSTKLFRHIMTEFRLQCDIQHPTLIYLLSLLFLGGDRFLNEHVGSQALGTVSGSRVSQLRLLAVVQKRALLAGSLFDVKNLGRFLLFDVCVSGIPTDLNGAVFAGTSDQPRSDMIEEDFLAEKHFDFVSNQQDLTSHIEPDWENDPDKVLVCIRYQGRRVRTIDPLEADAIYDALRFPDQYQDMEVLEVHDITRQFQQWSISDLLTKGIPQAIENRVLVYMRISLQHQRSRYFVQYFFVIYNFQVRCLQNQRVTISRKWSRVVVLGTLDDEREDISS